MKKFMENEFYYVYCNRVLGVKTNIKNFKWIYGSVAPETKQEEYEKCKIKFDICLKPEKELSEGNCNYNFQSYKWNDSEKTISFRRSFFKGIKIGYNIKITEKTVFAEIGENYYKFVKNRVMNLHGIYYLLSDLANIMLLEKGFLTLYASAVYFIPQKRGIVFFAPPNTGKTLTATELCKQNEYGFIGEDIVITDGTRLFSCPWTSSYRKSRTTAENGGSFGRKYKAGVWNNYESCGLTDMAILSLQKSEAVENKNRFFRKMKILNGYLFNYYSSPIIKLLGYFDEKYSKSWNEISENKLEEIASSIDCYEIYAEEPMDFSNKINKRFLGDNL